MAFRPRALATALTGAAAGALVLLAPSAASAHSLDSSTLAVRVTDDSVAATVSVAVETLDAALGTDASAATDTTAYTGEVVTWEKALNSKEDLSPAKYAWGDAPVRPVPRPGSSKLA